MRYKNITTRCGLMLSVGMRLPRESQDKTKTLHACVGVFCVIGFFLSVLACLVVHNMNC